MKMCTAEATLLVVDIQTGLLPAIADGQRVCEAAAWLLRLAGKLQVPVVVSEHFPEKIGETVPELLEVLPPAAERVRKTAFSAVRDGVLEGTAVGRAEQVVVAGTEAHVCVLQTVLDLLEADKRVFVVAESVGSRRAEDRLLALERMRQAGAVVVCREMVAFEWLERGGTDLFRDVLRTLIR